jgi:hypothetical protein
MPGVHMLAPVTIPHVAPMGPPEGVQFDPLQQRFGWGADWGVHVSPEPQAPAKSQRQPRVPIMHVEDTPVAGTPLPELAPEEPPELDDDPLELPLDPVDASSTTPNWPLPLPLPLLLPPEPSGGGEEPPQAHITTTSASDPTMPPRPARDVRSVMPLSSCDKPGARSGARSLLYGNRRRINQAAP